MDVGRPAAKSAASAKNVLPGVHIRVPGGDHAQQGHSSHGADFEVPSQGRVFQGHIVLVGQDQIVGGDDGPDQVVAQVWQDHIKTGSGDSGRRAGRHHLHLSRLSQIATHAQGEITIVDLYAAQGQGAGLHKSRGISRDRQGADFVAGVGKCHSVVGSDIQPVADIQWATLGDRAGRRHSHIGLDGRGAQVNGSGCG